MFSIKIIYGKRIMNELKVGKGVKNSHLYSLGKGFRGDIFTCLDLV